MSRSVPPALVGVLRSHSACSDDWSLQCTHVLDAEGACTLPRRDGDGLPARVEWIGCFSDDADRHFKAGPHSYRPEHPSGRHTTSSCQEACAGFEYFALQANGEAKAN